MSRQAPDSERQPPVFLLGTVPVRRQPSPLARRFSQICSAAMAEALEGRGITPLEWAAIIYLFDEPGLDQTGLALRLGVDKTNVGLIIDELEKNGRVRREVHPRDGRMRTVHLTAAGTKLHDELGPELRAAQQRILQRGLSQAEANTFLNLLVRVIQANEALAKPGAGRRRRAFQEQVRSLSRQQNGVSPRPPRKGSMK